MGELVDPPDSESGKMQVRCLPSQPKEYWLVGELVDPPDFESGAPAGSMPA